MLRAQLIPLGAGVIAALLHLSVTLGSPGAFMLAYFAQAPIAAAGLAFGFMPAAMAAASAAAISSTVSRQCRSAVFICWPRLSTDPAE